MCWFKKRFSSICAVAAGHRKLINILINNKVHKIKWSPKILMAKPRGRGHETAVISNSQRVQVQTNRSMMLTPI